MGEPEQQPGAPTSREDIRSGAWSSEFYMYSFKVVPCSATYAHNWSLCPFVHPNEKARRRDPRVHSYEPLPCPFDKKGANCPHGDACNYTHNVYEYWLHPKRFRTQMCQQGAGCKRPLCFFAHNLQELRFAEGQLQRGGPPGAQDPSAGPAAAAAAGVQANLLPGLADARQQQAAAAAAAAAALGAAPYMPALVPYALMSPTAATANLPPLQGGGGLMAAALAGGAGMQQGRPVGAGQALQQQQAWLPGFITPQGYVVLGNAQGQLLPGGPMVGGGDIDPGFQQQQQQQQYLPTASQWHHGGTAGAPAASSAAAAAAVAACMPMAGSTSGYNALHLDPALDPALMSSQLSVVPDEQVLLSQTGGVRGGDSSSSFAMLQQQQQQHQQQRQQQDAAAAAAAAAVSGSGYSWSLNPVAPSTTSASVSMSVLSVPTVGLSSSASVPGSSNNSLSHIKPGQSGAPVSLDVLQATMQQMSMRDCHVRDL